MVDRDLRYMTLLTDRYNMGRLTEAEAFEKVTAGLDIAAGRIAGTSTKNHALFASNCLRYFIESLGRSLPMYAIPGFFEETVDRAYADFKRMRKELWVKPETDNTTATSDEPSSYEPDDLPF
jgi:hypothetical protein